MITVDSEHNEFTLSGKIGPGDFALMKSFKTKSGVSYVLTIDESTGGSISDALGIYDILSSVDCIGVVKRRADSAAAILLQACKLRFALKDASVFLHAVGIRKNYYSWERDLKNALTQLIKDYPKKNELIQNMDVEYSVSKILEFSESFYIQDKIEFILKERMIISSRELRDIMAKGKDFSTQESLDVGLIDFIL
ncbi:MAG: hypothetical protein M1320_00660 [Patescibacteria group bacterium]|nr:hypothetical protein [Patescibacteria group bacterium]